MKNRNTAEVNIYVNGSISKNLQGEQLSEMFDLKQNGAIAFTDYKKGRALCIFSGVETTPANPSKAARFGS